MFHVCDIEAASQVQKHKSTSALVLYVVSGQTIHAKSMDVGLSLRLYLKMDDMTGQIILIASCWLSAVWLLNPYLLRVSGWDMNQAEKSKNTSNRYFTTFLLSLKLEDWL